LAIWLSPKPAGLAGAMGSGGDGALCAPHHCAGCSQVGDGVANAPPFGAARLEAIRAATPEPAAPRRRDTPFGRRLLPSTPRPFDSAAASCCSRVTPTCTLSAASPAKSFRKAFGLAAPTPAKAVRTVLASAVTFSSHVEPTVAPAPRLSTCNVGPECASPATAAPVAPKPSLLLPRPMRRPLQRAGVAEEVISVWTPQKSDGFDWPPWTNERSLQLCGRGGEDAFLGKAPLLEGVSSVGEAVDMLNNGAAGPWREMGYCVVFSSSRNAYFLLYKSGEEGAALAAVGKLNRLDGGDPVAEVPRSSPLASTPATSASPPLWSAEQAFYLGGNTADANGGVVLLADTSAETTRIGVPSVEVAVNCLNNGHVQCSNGVCLITCTADGAQYLLYRRGMAEAALARIGRPEDAPSRPVVESRGVTLVGPLQDPASKLAPCGQSSSASALASTEASISDGGACSERVTIFTRPTA